MVLEKLLNINNLPNRIRAGAPWLNINYIENYGYVPVSYEPRGFERTELGDFPGRHKKEVKMGDLIIFDEYDEFEEDRFQFVDKEIYEMIMFDEIGGPVGIIVPSSR